MGFFSKLFNFEKADNKETEISISFNKNNNHSYEPEIPELQGNYAKAVFLNAYSKPSPIKEKEAYQAYLLYECGIKDVPAYHRKMIKEGYLAPSTYEEKLSALKVTDLKDILRELKLPLSGKKDALIQRILSIDSHEVVSKHFSQKLYSITQKGKYFLEDNEDYIRIHKHGNWEIDWQEYDSRKQPGYSFYDVVWGIFNERILTCTDFGRNEYYLMYELLMEENKRKRACQMILHVLYIDLSGTSGKYLLESYNSKYINKNELISNLYNTLFMAPGIIGPIAEFKDVYEEAFVDRLYEHQLPVQVCSKQLFKSIINALISNTFDEEYYNSELKKECLRFVNRL